MTEKTRKIMTLCVIHQEGQNRVLLGMKKRGFGAGRWNGYGGKVEAGETIDEGACREVREEAGIEIDDYKKMGIIEFEFQNEPKVLEVHIYRVTSYKGEPVETEEMRPQWFAVDEIPYDQMWSDDPLWMPYLLKDQCFKGSFLFDRPATAEHEGKIIEQNIHVVDKI